MFKLQSPLKTTYITQKFGENLIPVYKEMGMLGHNGIDFGASDGTPIYATHDGRVTFTGYDGSGGLGIVIRTNDEVDLVNGKSYAKTIYWHLKKDSIRVSGSQQVSAGDYIADADNTGMSTGSHLHFGLKPIAKGENDWTWFNLEQTNGYFGAIDPMPYLPADINMMKAFYTPMNFKETSDDVRKLQVFLKSQGFFTVEPTGFYGPKTADAVLAFQIAHVDLSWYEKFILRGTKVGPKTLSKLNELY